MSADRSDSRSSRPTTVKRKGERPPFKLCFSRQQETGRSDASVSKTNANVITPKFYSRETEDCARNADVSGTVRQIVQEDNKRPKELYRWPLLTSHTYGWWHDKGIRPRDPRFDFHKRTSELVSFQMKIFAEDRRLKGQSF